MEFNVQPYQLFSVSCWIMTLLLLWRVKNKYFRCGVLFLCVVLTFISPIRFKQRGGASLEQTIFTSETTLPERVIIDHRSFEERQKNALNTLKAESKEIMNEENQ